MSIAAAFPTLAGTRAFSQLLSGFGLEEVDDLAGLVSHKSRGEVLDEVARLLIDFDPARVFEESLPGVAALGNEVISPRTFSVRSSNALRRANQSASWTWGDLSKLCPAVLLSFANLGMRSAVEVVSRLALRALNALDEGLVPDGTTGFSAREAMPSAQQALVPPLSDDSFALFSGSWPAMRSWNVVVQWLQESSEVETLVEGLAELPRGGLPSDVASAWDAIRAVRLDEIVARPSLDMWGILLARVDERLGDARLQSIFWSRIGVAPPTLEQVGVRLDITRERVRQLQGRAELLVQELLDGEFARVRWRAAAAGRRLGTAFPTGVAWADGIIAAATAGVAPADGDRCRSLLLWLAGPYRQYSDGWTRSKDLPRRDRILAAFSDGNPIDKPMVIDALVADGLAPLAAAEWVAQKVSIREVDGSSYLWDGTVADKAFTLLKAWGEPATAENLTEAIDEGHSVRSTRMRLFEDERFKRVDRRRFGLRDWEMDEYTGIADELAEEIERRGGSCELSELVATVSRNYNLRPTSVEAYTGVPRFVTENGLVRLRREGERFEPRRSVADESRCYVLSDRVCSYRLLVDSDVLRGSGRPVPAGLGVWLGVMPGGRRLYSFETVDVPVTWPDSALMGPSIGSLRRVVEDLNARPGNWVRLTFDRDRSTGTATLVDLDRLLRLSKSEQVALLTGVDGGPEELEHLLGAAVGTSAGSGLRERLRQRGEDDLLSLMSSRSTELDEALDRLKELF